MLKSKKILKQIFIPVLSILIIFSTFTEIPTKADNDITKELKKEILPLKTVEPKDDLKDLMPLKEILKDKEIVGMGEATHGTSEFFKMKHRVYKFLVQEMGYRAFAIEANFGEGEIINDYILNKNGDEQTALSTFSYPIWRTDELKEMLNWMRDYNLKAKEKDKIRFYGYDMQEMTKEYSILKKYFNKTSPELEDKLLKEVSPKINSQNFKVEESITKNKVALKEIIRNVEDSKNDLINKSSLGEYETMIKNLDVMNQCLDLNNCFNSTDQYKYVSLRDKCMAENIKWIKNKESSLGNNKLMIWAHNGHVANSRYIKSDYFTMGKYLKDFYGDKYYILGFEFFKGKFNAKYNTIFTENELKESNDKTLGYLFNKLEIPIFYIDLKNALKNDKINRWFKDRIICINCIGASYDKDSNYPYIKGVNINDEFDGLIFISETTASKNPMYNLNKPIEPKQKCGTKDDEKISTITIVLSTGLILILVLICSGVIKGKNASK